MEQSILFSRHAPRSYDLAIKEFRQSLQNHFLLVISHASQAEQQAKKGQLTPDQIEQIEDDTTAWKDKYTAAREMILRATNLIG